MKLGNVNFSRSLLTRWSIFLACVFLGLMTLLGGVTLEQVSGLAVVSVFVSVANGISISKLSQVLATPFAFMGACLVVMCNMEMCMVATAAV